MRNTVQRYEKFLKSQRILQKIDRKVGNTGKSDYALQRQNICLGNPVLGR